jgi:hypothetical protein
MGVWTLHTRSIGSASMSAAIAVAAAAMALRVERRNGDRGDRHAPQQEFHHEVSLPAEPAILRRGSPKSPIWSPVVSGADGYGARIFLAADTVNELICV